MSTFAFKYEEIQAQKWRHGVMENSKEHRCRIVVNKSKDRKFETNIYIQSYTQVVKNDLKLHSVDECRSMRTIPRTVLVLACFRKVISI